MVNDLALDWVGRRLYIAQVVDTTLAIRVLALDNREVDVLLNKDVPSDTMVKTTLSPYTG